MDELQTGNIADLGVAQAPSIPREGHTKWMSSDRKCGDGATSIGLKLWILLAKYQVGEKNAVGL